jgi:hypothetical protein
MWVIASRMCRTLPPSGILALIEQQIQLKDIDHLRAKDTSLCR